MLVEVKSLHSKYLVRLPNVSIHKNVGIEWALLCGLQQYGLVLEESMPCWNTTLTGASMEAE